MLYCGSGMQSNLCPSRLVYVSKVVGRSDKETAHPRLVFTQVSAIVCALAWRAWYDHLTFWRLLQDHPVVACLLTVPPVVVLHVWLVGIGLLFYGVRTAFVWVDKSFGGIKSRFYIWLYHQPPLASKLCGHLLWKRQRMLHRTRYVYTILKWDTSLSELMCSIICNQHKSARYDPFLERAQLVQPV